MVKRNFVKKLLKNRYLFIIFSLSLTFFLFLIVLSLYFQRRIIYGIYILDYSVGGLTLDQTQNYLKTLTLGDKIILNANDQVFEIPLKEIDFAYDFQKTLQEAYFYGHSNNLISNGISFFIQPLTKTQINLSYKYNPEKLENFISVIAGQVAVEPVYPSITLTDQGIIVQKGKAGKDADRNVLIKSIQEMFASAKFNPIEIGLLDVDPSISDEQAKLVQKQAEAYVGKNIIVSFEFNEFPISDKELIEFLDPSGGYKEEAIVKKVDTIAQNINRGPQNAVFVFEEDKVKEFAPAQDGIEVHKAEFKEKIVNALTELQTNLDQKTISIEIPVSKVPPKITIEDVNNLGIKELIGRGTSKFAHSIPSRVHNVALASSKFNGVLVEPGKTFSFNYTLGDVSSFTGYKQAYVIRDGKTVLGDGGGVCQVSTTLFRAILSAGLPIVERRAHSYRVGYYEQDSPPGIDATVYAPTTDLKFINDTPGHILIQTKVDTKNYSLVFEIYGTSDGRVATTTKPVVTSVTPPPDDLYVDDPTLPTGTIKQIDYKAWGAKVTFNYTVKRNDEIIYEKTFLSNYRSWQAVYLRGTGVQ